MQSGVKGPHAKSHVIAVVRRCCLQDVAPAVVVAPVYPLLGGPQNRAVASVHVLMARSSDLQRPRTRGEETSALSRGRRSSSRSFWRSLSCVFRVALFAANECVIVPRGCAVSPRESCWPLEPRLEKRKTARQGTACMRFSWTSVMRVVMAGKPIKGGLWQPFVLDWNA